MKVLSEWPNLAVKAPKPLLQCAPSFCNGSIKDETSKQIKRERHIVRIITFYNS